ncbi:MAG: pyridoxamine 5'-phosphate oxidase family protein [Acidobacteria bacterium]|nr:MAG: pyridoxamine 5'-phosphate oxidase family protein [Acidobacteriota bacterium]REK02854.1 MAG: pyridoxamine 5'-phosphate oxidase family protein [Acidobacteriota bacterium]REK13342.1 MAG: pyridoxamine 5'-phosphate oxidase family protein [Acidobacteriota bacterium]REK41336.1 MAG: pyridoxamine 5'-phosphate oxidase family protein [Acidobacteriota bacterium]
MREFEKNERNTVRRQSGRGKYDRETVYAILDEAFLCHVGFSVGGQPFVIPTLYARDTDRIFIHGSSVSRMLKDLSEGIHVCITVTITDGIVLARSAFHHSMNYRSVTAFGKGYLVDDHDKKMRALELISENVLPGRWNDARLPTQKEMDVTSVICVEIEDAAAKIREGDPKDDKRDYELPIWAGVLPVSLACSEPVADSLLREGIAVPDYIEEFVKDRSPDK